MFTDTPFSGNQLAVFPDVDGITEKDMQLIARELNLSETTFVLTPHNPVADYKVRIFTSLTELPMAGHPTIGTAFVLANEGKQKIEDPRIKMRLEEKIGIVPVTVECSKGETGWITMAQPLPTFGPVFENSKEIAQMLSLDENELGDTPIEVVSCGVPFLFVPIKTLDAMKNIRLRLDIWERLLKNFVTPHLFVFTRQVVRPESTVHSIMFAPALGISEDPATGGARGPLGCYLVKNDVVEQSRKIEFVSEQGMEMGRASRIKIAIEMQGRKIVNVSVSGQCCKIGEGSIFLR